VATSDRVKFRGTPRALVAAVGQAAAERGGVHAVRFDAAATGRARALDAVAVSVAADPIVRLNLPSDTPPGTYSARMNIGGRDQAVEIVVEPEIVLRLLPARLVFDARPGERVPFELTLMNTGNVAVELRSAYAFGVFDVAGPERAIGKMVGEVGEGKRRIDVLADAVAEEHGGLVRVKVEKGAGEIVPGTSQDLAVTIYVPERLRPGHTYWGTWPIHNLKYYVRITGQSSGEPRPEAKS
jgi:hypothetical protein